MGSFGSPHQEEEAASPEASIAALLPQGSLGGVTAAATAIPATGGAHPERTEKQDAHKKDTQTGAVLGQSRQAQGPSRF